MQRPDLTVLAIPAFIGAMGAEYWWQRRNPAAPGTTRAGDYELSDTFASLTMGVGRLLAPSPFAPVTVRSLLGVVGAATAFTWAPRLSRWAPTSSCTRSPRGWAPWHDTGGRRTHHRSGLCHDPVITTARRRLRR